MSDIKVTDRRMFTPDGLLREEYERELAEPRTEERVEEPAAAPDVPEPAAAPEPPSLPEPAAQPAVPAGALPASAPESPPPGLLELVEFLAGWALVGMGEMPLPDGRLARDLDGARFYIDLIGALHERWGPRLGLQEKRFLESYLDQLRLRYVSHRG